MKRFKSVTEFLESHQEYYNILHHLRSIILQTELEETIKWGMPVYTCQSKNLVGLGAFKSYAGLWFFQGGLLKDSHNRLVNAQEGKTKAMRQMRFSSIDEIDEDLILSYIHETIDHQKAGRSINPEKKKSVEIPDFLKNALQSNEDLHSAFSQLTPGRQHEYAEYIDTAKREATKQSRLEKISPMILEGKGLNDRYK